jgi:hypothetical protein
MLPLLSDRKGGQEPFLGLLFGPLGRRPGLARRWGWAEPAAERIAMLQPLPSQSCRQSAGVIATLRLRQGKDLRVLSASVARGVGGVPYNAPIRGRTDGINASDVGDFP